MCFLLCGVRGSLAREAWSVRNEYTYKSVVSYISGIRSLMGSGNRLSTADRVLIKFLDLIKQGVIDMDKDWRPRAQMIIVYYFGLIRRFQDTCFIGNKGRRGICAISTAPVEVRQDPVAWPLLILAEGSLLRRCWH